MNQQILAIVKKDFRAITANRRMYASLFIVPLVLTLFIPTVFILLLYFMPEQIKDMQALVNQLPLAQQAGDLRQTVLNLLFNYILPIFFLIIPIMSSSIMAATSFIGEKEKHTLETLLYSPLSLQQIFRSKVLASFALSMLVCFVSFAAMLLVVELEVFFTTGSILVVKISWLLVLFLVAPAISLVAITLIVRVSAKAQSVEDAQQGAVFLVLPVIALLVGQFTGIFLANPWLFVAIGVLCALLAALLMKKAAGKFSYEFLLK